MNKKAGFIIFLMVVSLSVLAYLLLTSKEITFKSKNTQDKEEYSRQVAENIKRMEVEFKLEFASILSEFKAARLSPEAESEIDRKAIEAKNKIYAIKAVPTQFTDLVMNMFLAFSKMEGATGEQVEIIAEEISALIAEAENSYDWLR